MLLLRGYRSRPGFKWTTHTSIAVKGAFFSCLGDVLKHSASPIHASHGTDHVQACVQAVSYVCAFYAGCTESDPYWARAWPSAVALATQILQRPELVRGARVVELGSGLGLAGMAALRAGGWETSLQGCSKSSKQNVGGDSTVSECSKEY